MPKKKTPPEQRSPLGLQIEALREYRGWTRQQLAEKAGVSLANVGHWETGRSAPPAKKLAALAALLGAEPRLMPVSGGVDAHAAEILLRLAALLPRVPLERREPLMAMVRDLEERFPPTQQAEPDR